VIFDHPHNAALSARSCRWSRVLGDLGWRSDVAVIVRLRLEPVGDWQQNYLVSSVDDLVASIPERCEVADLARCQRLSEGIDGVFRTEVAAQYPGWPPGSTTDGASVDICFRRARHSLEVIGLMYIDFAGEVFPFRALIERTGSSISLDGFIGEVDARTGRPPRLPAGTMINPVREGTKSAPTPELLSGRRASPIVWTKVLTWSCSHKA
jgi:hypothetical protein